MLYVITVTNDHEDDGQLVTRMANDVFHHASTDERLRPAVRLSFEEFRGGQFSSKG